LHCWTDDASAHAGRVVAPRPLFAGLGIDFSVAQLVVDGDAICARTPAGRVRCGDLPSVVYQASAPGGMAPALHGVDLPDAFFADDIAVGVEGDGVIVCALGHGASTALSTIECCVVGSTGASWRLQADASSIDDIAIGDGGLCAIESGLVRCTVLAVGTSATWSAPLHIAGDGSPDDVREVLMRGEVLCVRRPSSEYWCRTRAEPFTRRISGVEGNIASEGVSVSAGELDLKAWSGELVTTSLLHGVIEHGLACGNASAGSDVGSRALVCEAISGATSRLVDGARRLSAHRAGEPVPVCPYVPPS
jgi:hypothetical protein